MAAFKSLTAYLHHLRVSFIDFAGLRLRTRAAWWWPPLLLAARPMEGRVVRICRLRLAFRSPPDRLSLLPRLLPARSAPTIIPALIIFALSHALSLPITIKINSQRNIQSQVDVPRFLRIGEICHVLEWDTRIP